MLLRDFSAFAALIFASVSHNRLLGLVVSALDVTVAEAYTILKAKGKGILYETESAVWVITRENWIEPASGPGEL